MNPLLAQIGNNINRAVGQAAGKGADDGAFLESVFSSLNVFKNIIISILIVLVFYLIGKFIARRIVKQLKHAQGESLYPDMVTLINRFIVFGSLFIGFAVVIQFIFDFDFVQVVGFFGLGISFAFKDLLSNLIAGAVIILQNRYHTGDFIMVGSDPMLKGKIMEIQTRATILKAIDGTEIILPNSELMVKPVTSFTAHHSRRINFIIGISYEADIEHAMKVALEEINKHPHVLQKPAAHVLVDQVADSSINLDFRFWIDPKDPDFSWIITRSELTKAVKEAFDREGIEIPFPIRTLQGGINTNAAQKKPQSAPETTPGTDLDMEAGMAAEAA